MAKIIGIDLGTTLLSTGELNVLARAAEGAGA